MVSFAGLLLSVGTSFSIFCVLVVTYTVLSFFSANDFIFFPAKLRKRNTQFRTRRNPISRAFGSFIEAFLVSSSDFELLGGLDASVYIQFLETGFKISCTAAVFGICVLLPACITDNFYYEYNSKQRSPEHEIAYDTLDILSMGNVNREGPRMCLFVFGAWWIAFFTCFYLFKASRSICAQLMKYRLTRSPQLAHYVVLVRDIPPPAVGQTQQEHVESYFQTLYPDEFVKSVVVVPHARAFSKWKSYESLKDKLIDARLELEEAEDSSSHSSCMPKITQASISSMEKKVLIAQNRWLQERKKALKEMKSGAAFVLFKSRSAASQASQILLSPLSDAWTVTPAPDPWSVRWAHITVSVYERAVRKWLVWIAVAIVLVFYLIPVSFVSALANVKSMEQKFHFLRPLLELPLLKRIVDAYLPQIVLKIFLQSVPYMLTFLSAFMGHPSKDMVLRSAFGIIFLFLVMNVFLGVSISGTLFSTLQQILVQPAQVFVLLGTAVPSNAAFFISYVALIFYISLGLELCQLYYVVKYRFFAFKNFYSSKKSEKMIENIRPITPKYHLLISKDLFIITLGLCYAVIAPLILVFMSLYFGFALLVYRHQFLNVYVPRWESEGSLWPAMHARVLAALFVSQLTLIGYFGLNGSLTTLCILPLPVLTTVFGWFLKKRYDRTFERIPLEALETRDPNGMETPSIEKFIKAYMPECLKDSSVVQSWMDEDTSAVDDSPTAPLLLSS